MKRNQSFSEGASWLVHGSNLYGKIEQDYRGRKKDFLEFARSKYLPYREAQLKITGITKADIVAKSELYDDYSRSVDVFNQGNWITAQSKFRPTVLEEFCGFLFKDLASVKTLGLGFFKKGIYAGLRIDSKGNVEIETRDIDFCISKEVTALIGETQYGIIIPVVAVECKTYLDKTMLSGAQFTAQKLKGGTPRVKVFVITERNEVDLKEIPSESSIDQIYVVRDGGDKPIASDVVWDFFSEVKVALERATKEQIIKLPGRLLIR